MKRVVRIKSDGGLHSKTMSEQPKFTIQGTRKKEQIKPKVSRSKAITKIRAEINERDHKKQSRRSLKLRADFILFFKIKKIYELLVRQTLKNWKRTRTQNHKKQEKLKLIAQRYKIS